MAALLWNTYLSTQYNVLFLAIGDICIYKYKFMLEGAVAKAIFVGALGLGAGIAIVGFGVSWYCFCYKKAEAAASDQQNAIPPTNPASGGIVIRCENCCAQSQCCVCPPTNGSSNLPRTEQQLDSQAEETAQNGSDMTVGDDTVQGRAEETDELPEQPLPSSPDEPPTSPSYGEILDQIVEELRGKGGLN